MKTAAAFTLLLIAGASAGDAHTAHLAAHALLQQSANGWSWHAYHVQLSTMHKSTSISRKESAWRLSLNQPQRSACQSMLLLLLLHCCHGLQPATAGKIGAG
jgi:hypothetical protein